MLSSIPKYLKPTFSPECQVLELIEKHFLGPLLCQKSPDTCELFSVAPTKQFGMSGLDERDALQISETVLNSIVSELLYCKMNKLFKMLENTVKISSIVVKIF